jgi:Ca2+-binding RTX toxin-like protein
VDGGADHDLLLGGAGAENLFGGAGDDILLGGGGIDILDDTVGENILLQEGGCLQINGLVALFGTPADDTMTITRGTDGALLLNGVAIPGATISSTTQIRIFGLGGNDTLAVDETSGALPPALLFGGPGQDTLSSGAGENFSLRRSRPGYARRWVLGVIPSTVVPATTPF